MFNLSNKILAFDTSNNNCSVSISQGQDIIYFERDMRPSVQAERLILMIEDALQFTKLKYKDIDYLATTVGPGSFTGIRVGLSAAIAITYASDIKPIAITNFQVSYYRVQKQVKCYRSVFIILNAYRDQCYVQEFHSDKVSKPVLLDNLEIKNLLSNVGEDSVCAGSGVLVLYDDICNIKNLTILPRFPSVKALHIARFADMLILSGDATNILDPLYIRPADT